MSDNPVKVSGAPAPAPAPVGSEPVVYMQPDGRVLVPDGSPLKALLNALPAPPVPLRGPPLLALFTSQALSGAHSAGMREGMEKAAQWHDGEMVRHAELAYSYRTRGNYGVANDESETAMIHKVSAAAIRSLQPAIDQPKDAP